MKVQKMAAFMILMLMITFHAFGDDQKTGTTTNTRLNVFFSELETQWLKAEQDKDPAALNRIVADDFHVITPKKNISHSEWLLAAFGRRLLSFHVRQLAVREVSPTVSLVSFIRTETYQQTATPQTEEHFVVDVWINTGAGDNWHCTDRYLSEFKGTSSK